MEKQELQALRLWNPLFPKIYRKNEWGDTENEPEDIDANEIVEYQEEILAAIEREKLPNEGERSARVSCVSPASCRAFLMVWPNVFSNFSTVSSPPIKFYSG